jgi:hypothetical protein
MCEFGSDTLAVQRYFKQIKSQNNQNYSNQGGKICPTRHPGVDSARTHIQLVPLQEA